MDRPVFAPRSDLRIPRRLWQGGRLHQLAARRKGRHLRRHQVVLDSAHVAGRRAELVTWHAALDENGRCLLKRGSGAGM